MLNEAIKADFPTLNQKINGNDLIYLDNAATTQKPANVIKAVENYYKLINSNIHRGVHTLSGKATEAYENARSNIAEFIGEAVADLAAQRGQSTGKLKLTLKKELKGLPRWK